MFRNSLIQVFALGLSVFGAIPSGIAEVREASSMREIIPLIGKKTVVVFDLDNTVIEAAQTLGSDQFFEFLVGKAKGLGLQGEHAIAWALERASKVQPVSPVRPVEAMTPSMIDSLQKQGIPTVALTARPIEWAVKTIGQLDAVGVDFTRSPLYLGDLPFGPDGGGRNLQGVLFMPKGGDKGRYLKSFFEASGIQADQLIFIDDKLRNVQSVDLAFNQGTLPHIEFRYGSADPRVAQFSTELAEFEWDYFLNYEVFLSDEQACGMMKKNCTAPAIHLVETARN